MARSLVSVIDNKKENKIINGNFDFAQRGSSFTGLVTSGFPADRFKYGLSGPSVVDSSLPADVPTFLESGFLSQRSLMLTYTTGTTPLTARRSFLQYNIEGYDWSTMVEKKAVLSFWVKAGVTGINCVAFRNNGSDRTYIAEYTINVANTWEKKEISIDFASIGGTQDYTNNLGLGITWSMMQDIDLTTATTNAWQVGSFLTTVNQVNQVVTSNTFQLAQIQLVEGESASSKFQRAGKSIGGELVLCQRYYEKSYNVDANPGSITTGGRCAFAVNAFGTMDNASYVSFNFRVRKRTNPTMTSYASSSGSINKFSDISGTDQDCNLSEIGHSGFSWKHADASSTTGFFFHYTAEAEL